MVYGWRDAESSGWNEPAGVDESFQALHVAGGSVQAGEVWQAVGYLAADGGRMIATLMKQNAMGKLEQEQGHKPLPIVFPVGDVEYL